MSSFAKKILGAFVEVPENEQKTQQSIDPSKPIKPQMTGQPPVQQQSNTYTLSPSPISTSAGSLEDLNNFRQHFKTILEDYNKNEMPGLDYFEFVLMKDNMPVPVEAQRYTITFSQARVAFAGLTKETLLTTADKYVAVIDKESAEFTSAYQGMYKEQIQDKEAIVEQKTQQMNEYSQKIGELSAEIAKLKDEAIQAKSMLESKRGAFEQAANEAKQKITDEKQKIDQFIQ